MSYATRNMRQKEPVNSGITIAVPSSHNTHAELFPHMLKQHNPTSLESPFTPARVNVVVSPHVHSSVPMHVPMAQAQVSHVQLYPNQSQSHRQKAHVAEDDWNQHAILTSVAGLQTKLVELDSEIRTAPADAGNVMRHIQDHATILAEHAKHTSLASQRQKEVASVTHEICSHMSDQLDSHAAALQRYQNNISNLQHKQKNTAGLAHEICSQLHSNLEAEASVPAGLEKSMNQYQTHVEDVRNKHSKTASLTHEICSQLNSNLEAQASVTAGLEKSMGKHLDNISKLEHKQSSAASLTHEICSQLHDNLQAQASVTAGLEKNINTYESNVVDLHLKHSSTAALTHEICSQLNINLEAQSAATEGLQHDLHRQSAQIAHMHKKDEVAQTLLTKMLTMVGNHENVISKLSNTLSPDHHVLLDAMCEALEKTKGKLQNFERTQNEMQRILSDFQQGKLVANTQAQDAQSIRSRLDTYAKMSKEMDVQFSQTLQAQQSKIRELEQKVAMMSSSNHNAKLHELEDKVQELSLHQLNSSQNASVMRTTDRDVKLLRHEISHVHALKQDVEMLKEQHATNRHEMSNIHALKQDVQQLKQQQATDRHEMSNVHALRQDVQSLTQEHKRNNVKTDVTDMQAKLQELRRDMMMQDVRIDKTHMHINEMRKKIDA